MATPALDEMAAQILELRSYHLPAIVELLNDEFRSSNEFIPFNEERILSQIRIRHLKVLVAEENGEAIGMVGTHTHDEENLEEHITWLVASEDGNQMAIKSMLVNEVEKNARGRTVSIMVDEGSPETSDWISRGYTLYPGFQRMSARIDGPRPLPRVAEGIRLRSLSPYEEEKLVAAVNAGFGWRRLEVGVLDTWKADDPPFSEDWVQVAEIDGQIVSAVVARPDTEYVRYLRLKRAYLGPASTLAEFRNKHLASALTVKAMNFLFEKGIDSVRLGTSEENASSIALLRNLGFQVDIVRKALRKNRSA